MKKTDCVFMSETDCPKEGVGLDCDTCIKNKSYEIIEKALNDFVDMGDAFTSLFIMCNKLMKNKDQTCKIDVNVEHIKKIHRVMTAFLTSKEVLTENETLYRRLIFHFFGLIVDEFKEREYEEKEEFIH